MDIFPNSMEYRVAYADTDQMGVVYYANFLVMFERARSHLLRQAGYPYDRFEAEGFQLPVVEAHVDYVQPAHYEDLLTLSASPEFIGHVRVKLFCRVHRGADLLAHGYTVHVCYSPEKKKPVRFPAGFLGICGQAAAPEPEA